MYKLQTKQLQLSSWSQGVPLAGKDTAMDLNVIKIGLIIGTMQNGPVAVLDVKPEGYDADTGEKYSVLFMDTGKLKDFQQEKLKKRLRELGQMMRRNFANG